MRLLRADEPLISLEVLSNPIVLAGTVSMFLLQAASIGLSVYLPVYLQAYVGLSASQSGMSLLGLLLGTVAGASMSGRWIPRFTHYKRIALGGAAFSVVCLAALSLVAGSAPLWIVEVLAALIGFGSGTGFPVSTVSVQNAVDRAHLGVATGVLTFLRSLGGALGVAILGAVALGYGLPLVERGMQGAAPVESAAPFAMIFLVSALLMLGSFIALAFMPEKPLRGAEHAAPVSAE